MGVPCIDTRIYDLQDSIIEDHTGMLVSPRNIETLRDALKYLFDHPEHIN